MDSLPSKYIMCHCGKIISKNIYTKHIKRDYHFRRLKHPPRFI